MRFIHFSDMHLGKCFSSTNYGVQFARKRKEELFQTFAAIIEFANKNMIDFLICSGDFLHQEDLSIEDLRNINTILSQLERGKLIVISGNHDPQTNQNAYSKIYWTKKLCLCPPGFGSLSLAKHSTVIHYHSWDTKEIRENLLEKVKFDICGQYDILMLHGDCVSPTTKYFPLATDSLKELKFQYIALGHIHRPIQISDNIWYSGSPEPFHFGEDGPHGFILCETEGERIRSQFIPIAQREYITIDVDANPNDSELSIAERIIKRIIQENTKNVYKVNLIGRHNALSSLNIPMIEDNVREKECYCSIEDKTIPDYDISELYRENRSNIIGDFISSFGNQENLTVFEKKALDYGIRALLSQKGGI